MSYAFFTLTLNGTKQNSIRVGKLSLNLTEGTVIHLENALPTSIETALQETPYHFTVENNGTTEAEYTLTLKNTGTLTDPYSFNYALKKDGQIITVENLLYVGENNPFFKGTISPGETATYDLYIWLDYNEDGSNITEGQYYEGTLLLESYQQKERKLSDYVYHACDGKEDCLREVEGTTYFQTKYYYSHSFNTKYVWYSGNLWFITGYDENGNMKAVSTENVTYIPWGTTVDYTGSYVEHWLQNKFLPTLNNYQKFLVTDYTWNYSTEVASNTFDGLIGNDKLVTGPVGLLNKRDIFYSSDGNDAYTVGDEINQVLPYRSYLGTPTNKGNLWVSGMSFWALGYYVLGSTNYSPGIAPSVVFRNDVIVLSGDGTEKDPYRLKGDTYGKNGELLNKRKGGEYVAFGDGLNYMYRMMGVENDSPKIVSAYPLTKIELTSSSEGYKTFQYFSNLTEVKNNRMPYVINGANALGYDATSTNYPIAYFLNHDFLSPLNGYLTSDNLAMIATNQTWYTGTVTGSDSYENAKDPSKQVTATVALPSLGDSYSAIGKFESTFISNSSRKNLLLTNNGSSLYTYSPIGTSGAAQLTPTFYLKNNVKIKSGRGTRLDPYILTME